MSSYFEDFTFVRRRPDTSTTPIGSLTIGSLIDNSVQSFLPRPPAERALCDEAQDHFNKGNYEKSADLFAKSKRPFEEVCLMFMEAKNLKALRRYLKVKLKQYLPEQGIRATMILAWMVEIINSSINLMDKDDKGTVELHLELEELLEDKQVVEIISQHAELFYGILRNFSDLDAFVRIAKLIGDYERVIEHYMNSGEFKKAFDVVKYVGREDYFYKYGHILMKKMPKEFVDALIESPNIKPFKLITILIQENFHYSNYSETIRYLEYCIQVLRVDSRVIHNYLFELYARYRDEATLILFLESEVHDDSRPCYLDLQSCLILCTELKLYKTCVSLYSCMGLFDDALHLAMEIDLELAKSIAKKPDSDEDQKRLWLYIVKDVLKKEPDIQTATSLLRESKLLKIEDILCFFEDHTTIDYFKDAIIRSLQECNEQVMSIKDGTYDQIADEIRTEIKSFKNRYSIVKASQQCELCSKPLTNGPFFVYPCNHLFHRDCVINEIIDLNPDFKGIREKLCQLALNDPAAKTSHNHRQNQNFAISSMSSQTAKVGGATGSREKVARELDDIILSECVLCGSLLLSCIDKPAPASSAMSSTRV